MRKGDTFLGFLVIMFFIIIIIGAIFFNGFFLGIRYNQLEAVKNGVAEWVADEKGQAQFKWKNEQVQP